MAGVYDCDPQEFVEKASEELKKNGSVKPPKWAVFVKTGVHKERPPVKDDWWYVRSASVLRKIYRFGPVGVSKLRTKYGGKKNRGYQTEHAYKGSGNILRKILQQLEKAGYVKQGTASIHKGRVLTANGKKFLDSVASQLVKGPAEKPSRKAPKAAETKKAAAKSAE